MSCLDPHSIDALGELPVNGLQQAVQAVHACRHNDQVNVIRHETVRDDFDAAPARMIVQEFEVPDSVSAVMKHLLSVIPALSDVVGYTWKHDSGVPRHAHTLRVGETGRDTVSCARSTKTTKVNVPF